jgi:hypothetical protein
MVGGEEKVLDHLSNSGPAVRLYSEEARGCRLEKRKADSKKQTAGDDCKARTPTEDCYKGDPEDYAAIFGCWLFIR